METASTRRAVLRFLALAPLLALAVGFAFLAADDEDAPPSEFLRFVEEGDKEGRLETAIITYRRNGVEVDLVAAVHVGDGGYYRRLNRLFTGYDALLYEMIKEKGAVVRREEPSGSLLSMFQRGLKDVLDLEFQLDAVDYTKSNFVHADLDPATFFRLQRAKGESVLTLMLNAMFEQWKREMKGKGSQLNVFHLLAALASEDSARALKYLLAREFGDIEAMLAGLDKGSDGEGSVLLSGRNRAAMKVLRRELREGRKKLGVFYGAAHMQDMEKRLRRLGFRKAEARWVTAWDIRRKKEAEKGAEQGAKEEAPEDAEAEASEEPPDKEEGTTPSR